MLNIYRKTPAALPSRGKSLIFYHLTQHRLVFRADPELGVGDVSDYGDDLRQLLGPLFPQRLEQLLGKDEVSIRLPETSPLLYQWVPANSDTRRQIRLSTQYNKPRRSQDEVNMSAYDWPASKTYCPGIGRLEVPANHTISYLACTRKSLLMSFLTRFLINSKASSWYLADPAAV